MSSTEEYLMCYMVVLFCSRVTCVGVCWLNCKQSFVVGLNQYREAPELSPPGYKFFG